MDNEQFWARWGELTRFLQSTQVAFGRERSTWELLKARNRAEVRIRTKVGRLNYDVRLDQHLAALADLTTLYSSVLITTYALAESAALGRLGIQDKQMKIEDWGTKLLAAAGANWDQVPGGKLGVIEVSVMRNLFAHGAREFDGRSAKRIGSDGDHPRRAGDIVTISYEETIEYRNRLKNLLSAGGFS